MSEMPKEISCRLEHGKTKQKIMLLQAELDFLNRPLTKRELVYSLCSYLHYQNKCVNEEIELQIKNKLLDWNYSGDKNRLIVTQSFSYFLRKLRQNLKADSLKFPIF